MLIAACCGNKKVKLCFWCIELPLCQSTVLQGYGELTDCTLNNELKTHNPKMLTKSAPPVATTTFRLILNVLKSYRHSRKGLESFSHEVVAEDTKGRGLLWCCQTRKEPTFQASLTV